jgi:hypothetical protein
MLLWNYPIMTRFFVPFLPLLYLGLCVEGKHLISMLAKNLRGGRPPERIFAGVLGLAVLAVAGLGIRQYAAGARPGLRRGSRERAALEKEKQEMYGWVRRHTNPDTRLLPSEDVKLYLHTGRQALWPIAFSTASFHSADAGILRFQLDHIMDGALQTGARYWVAVEGDYYIETTAPLVRQRLSEVQSVLPEVFRSTGSRVRVYDLSCILRERDPDCRRALSILFPPGAASACSAAEPRMERFRRF